MADPETDQLGDLVRALAAVQGDLLALEEGDNGRRAELLSKQEALREQVARFQTDRDVGRSRAELEAELEALRARLEAIRDQRIDPVVQAGGGDAGWGNIGAIKINQEIMEAQGGDDLKTRIAQIEARLEKLANDAE